MLAAVTNAELWIAVVAVLGAAMIVAGVYILAGLGWCLIASGVGAVLAATYIKRGLDG